MDPSTIASVSLGPCERTFRVRTYVPPKVQKEQKIDPIWVFDQKLKSGSLFVMLDGMQEKYQHTVPVEKKVLGPRINLTFRKSL
jgi:alkylated DNA repair dioxygenase AlkB